jgi:hypothetical protein
MKTVSDHPNDFATTKTRWHRLLGSVFEQVLTPVGIAVYTDVR